MWLILLISYLKNFWITQEHKGILDFEIRKCEYSNFAIFVLAIHFHENFISNILCQKQVMKIWGSDKGFVEFVAQLVHHFHTPKSPSLWTCLSAFFFHYFVNFRVQILYIFSQFIPVCFSILTISMELVSLFVCLFEAGFYYVALAGLELCRPGCLQEICLSLLPRV